MVSHTLGNAGQPSSVPRPIWFSADKVNSKLLYEVFPRSHLVRRFLAAYEEATGMSFAIVPADPEAVTIPPRPHPICSMIAKTEDGCQACRQFITELHSCVSRTNVRQRMQCCAGLAHVAVPIVVGGWHVATLLGGQVFTRQPTQRDAARLVKLLRGWGTKISMRQAEEACRHTSVISEERLDATERLFTICAMFLAGESNRRMVVGRDGEPPCVKAAKEFVQARFAENLNIGGLARHVHLNVDYFARVFRKATGLTFTEYLARVRTEKARALLADLRLQIKQVAYAAGFRSVKTFDRVFRFCTAMSPTAYRASIRKK
jgi:AraC-like DNA-binding protein/ligand-binding sensor protein